jgi:hypothetical protein
MSAARLPRWRTDWFTVLADLNRAGVSNIEAGRRIGVATTTVHGWKSGSEPSHADGTALLELWAEAMGQPAGDRPQTIIDCRPLVFG